MKTRQQSLQRKIDQIKEELKALGELRPGSLSRQYNVCGTPSCRCKASPPKKHGPYYQVSFTRKGRGSSKFIRKEDVAEIRRELKSYERLKALIDRWIDIATELSNIRIEGRKKV